MKKTRVFCLMVVFCLLTCIVLASCAVTLKPDQGNDTENTLHTDNADNNDDTNTEESAETDTDTANNSADDNNSSGESIQESVLYEANGIKITAKKYDSDDLWGEGIKLLIENDSDKDITVSTNAVIVNDYMIDEWFSESVASGKKSNATLYVDAEDLGTFGISDIGKVEIYFNIYDSDTWDDIDNPDCITIKTNLFDSMDTTADFPGTVFYDKNGIKILGYYSEQSDYWGDIINIYCENNSGRKINMSTEDFSVNGFMIDSYFIETVYDGKKVLSEISVSSSELEENDITEIENISFKLKIYDSDEYELIDETDEIKLNIK